MNFAIWIRDPFPLRYDEYDALQEALKRIYGNSSVVYMREWPVDVVYIDDTNITTCKQIANTLKTIHLQQAMLDKKYRGRLNDYCQNLEIIIQGPKDSRPTWAQPQKEA